MTNVQQFPQSRRPEPFEPFSPTKWQGVEPPAFQWMVDGCFLRGTVAMLSGDGGLGKSLIMQQLCSAAALGKPWLGLATQKCKTFAMFCEDDEDELHRRQAKINALYECDHGDLESTLYISRVGLDTPLCEVDKRSDSLRPTSHYEALFHAVKDFGAQVVVLDTVADVFWGDEIRRGQVRKFVTLLRRLAVAIQGVVILTAHPSLSGMASGSGLSGSTAWNNSVRSRLYLTRINQHHLDEDQDEEERNERFLKTMKNNQGPYGDRIRVRWQDGVFVRSDVEQNEQGFLQRLDLDRKVVDALKTMVKAGTRIAADRFAKNGFAPRLKALPEFKHQPFNALVSAFDRQREAGRIVLVKCGTKSRFVLCARTPDTRYADEVAEEPSVSAAL